MPVEEEIERLMEQVQAAKDEIERLMTQIAELRKIAPAPIKENKTRGVGAIIYALIDEGYSNSDIASLVSLPYGTNPYPLISWYRLKARIK